MSIAYAVFAAGCFWGAQATFDTLPGVVETQVGYIGGDYTYPQYRDVVSGKSGHAEAVEISFDPEKISYENLLEVFFNTHNPTEDGRNGLESGKQYRSIVYYVGEDQKETAQKMIADINSSGRFSKPLVTQVLPAEYFYPAEQYHQKMLRRRTNKIVFVKDAD